MIGIITDGDLRRKVLDVQKPFSAFLNDDVEIHMKKNPVKVISKNNLKLIIAKMQKFQIWDLPVVNNKDILIGLVHLHPVIKKLLHTK